MMPSYTNTGLTCAFCAVFACVAVQAPPAQELDHALTELIDPDDGMTDPEAFERLEALRDEPLDLNTAGREAFEQLPWITPQQAGALVAWRAQNGRFSRVEALTRLPGFDARVVERIRPFVRVASPPPLHGQTRLFFGQRGRDGGSDAAWSGAQTALSLGRRLAWGARLERRSGQQPAWRSAYADARGIGRVERMVAGDFDLYFGQGLAFGGRGLRRIDGMSSNVKWRARDLVPARTSGQRGRYTGVAGQLDMRHVRVTAAWAQTRAGERMQGGRIGWSNRVSRIGVTAISVSRRAGAAGIDADLMIERVNVFGEVARSRHGGSAVVAGVQWATGRLDGGTVVSFVNRAFAGFQTLTSGQTRRPHTHWATRFRYRPDRATTVIWVYDVRRQQTTSAPDFDAVSVTMTASVQRRLFRIFTVTGLWREERADGAFGTASGAGGSTQWRGQVDWRITPRVRARGRIDRRTTPDGLTRAAHVLADLRYRTARGFTLSGQWSATYGSTVKTPSETGSEDEETDERINQRRRWSVFVYSPAGSLVAVSMRYTQSRSFRFALRVPSRTDVTWSLQTHVGF